MKQQRKRIYKVVTTKVKLPKRLRCYPVEENPVTITDSENGFRLGKVYSIDINKL